MYCPQCHTDVLTGAKFCIRCGHRVFSDTPPEQPERKAEPPHQILSNSVSDGREQWSKGRLLLDEFVVERELGIGGMGRVHLVRSLLSDYRFAVKAAKFSDANSRQKFLTELQTWIDLPEHPHLTACRFVRTVDDQIAVFAEYVEGGSLADWIRKHKLSKLEEILDVAIQFAWGLHTAHELGLVHQDVKPGNALMTSDGMVKVGDFGLAQARAHTNAEGSVHDERSRFVSGAGSMTPAYASPEQIAGLPLTRQTDIWSWGLSVLEMFTREVTWLSGQFALEVLESYLEGETDHLQSPAMPDSLAEVLRKCFRQDITERWSNMAEVADTLQDIYRRETGRAYPRQAPAIPSRGKPLNPDLNRLIIDATEGKSPQDWLRLALEADGQVPAGASAFNSPRAGSHKAQAIADLSVCEKAQEILERLIASGRNELKSTLVMLLIHRAYLHDSVDDAPGAVALFNCAIEFYETSPAAERSRTRIQGLAAAYFGKAHAVRSLGDNRAAVALYDRVIRIMGRLVNHDGRTEFVEPLIKTYLNKSNALSVLGDHRTAMTVCEEVINIAQNPRNSKEPGEISELLAMAYFRKASVAHDVGDNITASAFHDRAIGLLQPLVFRHGRSDLADDLAMAYQNKAIADGFLGDNRGSLDLYNRAIKLLEVLVKQNSAPDFNQRLAGVYLNKATALRTLGDNQAALADCDRAIDLYEHLVYREGRREFESDLAKTYMNKANVAKDIGDYRNAVALFHQAIKIWERLIHQEGRLEFKYELGTAYMNKATVIGALAHHEVALALYDQAIEIFDQLVNREGRHEVTDKLAMSYMNKASSLWAQDNRRAAAFSFHVAVEIWERLVNQEGRREYADHLALALINKAQLYWAVGNYHTAKAIYDGAVEILSRLINREGRRELMGNLAMARARRAAVLAETGDIKEAKAEVASAIPILQAEVERTGRADLQAVLRWALEACENGFVKRSF